jgi:hypothetical protein
MAIEKSFNFFDKNQSHYFWHENDQFLPKNVTICFLEWKRNYSYRLFGFGKFKNGFLNYF